MRSDSVNPHSSDASAHASDAQAESEPSAVRPVVVDASALGALLFGEPEADAVADRLETRALFVPTLLRYELAVIAWQKARAEPGASGMLGAALEIFERMGIREVQVSTAALLRGSMRLRLPIPDMAYLWLAHTLNAELVTLDPELQKLADEPFELPDDWLS